MCVGERWRELCYSGWDYKEAFVVCRQLGLPATGECVLIAYHSDTTTINLLIVPLFLFVCTQTAAAGEIHIT